MAVFIIKKIKTYHIFFAVVGKYFRGYIGAVVEGNRGLKERLGTVNLLIGNS